MERFLEEIKEDIVNNRRALHQIPELGFNEVATSKYIKDRLIEYGFSIEDVAKTGVIGFKKGNISNKAIAFRADMDALPVKEETGVDFKSKHQNMMHACGHDGHMAILLGLAKYLSKVEDIQRDIVLIFQPAEEGPGGAKEIVNQGILEKYNVEAIFGLHLFPYIDEGKIGVRPGPIMAQSGEVDITVTAKSGHGAAPHTAIDGIYVASQLISSYQSIVSRNIEPIEGAVVTIGKMIGGEVRNVIAEKVTLEGTIRAFNSEVYNTIKSRMDCINKGLEKMHKVTIDMVIRDFYPPVVNDENLFDLVKEIALEDEIEIIKPVMLAEDFSYYQEKIPGLFFMLGSRNEERGFTYPLHSCHFNFDEDVLVHGLDIYIRICKKLGLL